MYPVKNFDAIVKGCQSNFRVLLLRATVESCTERVNNLEHGKLHHFAIVLELLIQSQDSANDANDLNVELLLQRFGCFFSDSFFLHLSCFRIHDHLVDVGVRIAQPSCDLRDSDACRPC